MTAAVPQAPETKWATRVFVVALGIPVALLLPVSLPAVAEAPLEALLWVSLLSVANLFALPILPKIDLEAGIGAPLTVASAVLLPPPLALLVNVAAVTSIREFRRGTSPWAIAFNRLQTGVTAGIAAWAAASQPFGIVAGTVVAVVVSNFVNVLLVSVFMQTRGQGRMVAATRVLANPVPRFALDYGLVALLAVVIVLLYTDVGPLAVLLLAIPFYLGYSALQSARVAEDRAEALAAQVRDLEVLNALGTRLLGVRRPGEVAEVGAAALNAVYDAPVEVSLDGDLPVADRVRVPVPGAATASVLLPTDAGDDIPPVVEAAVSLLGMALQRLELEAEVAEGDRARIALSGRVLEEGTRERSRLALEIHDDVLPYLAAAEMQADNVRSAIGSGKPDRADELAVATGHAVHGGIARLRGVLESLRRQVLVPGSLRDGIVIALEELRVTAGVEPHLDAPPELPPMSLASEIVALELVRGCLTNIARHAAAHHVWLTMAVRGELLEIDIRDDGRGFDPDAVPEGHHGLALMAQRLQLARGRFAVTSAPGQGTSLRLEVPL